MDVKTRNVWEELDHQSLLVEKYTSRHEPDCVKLLQDAIGLLGEALEITPSLPDVGDASVVKMSMSSYNLTTLKCAVDITLRGYYNQSINLLRIVYENSIASIYLTEFPDKARLWMSVKKRPPKCSAMLKQLGEKVAPYKTKLDEWYGTLCRFAHTDAICIIPQISGDRYPNETTIHYGTTYKRERFRGSAYLIAGLIGFVLPDFGMENHAASEWHKKHQALEKRILDFIQIYHDEQPGVTS